VQTFLPYPSFVRTARVLDVRRLGKQRVEVLQILRALHVPGYGWRHHPVVRMWRGCDAALACYGLTIVERWRALGHADTVMPQLVAYLADGVVTQRDLERQGLLPWWLGWRPLHRSHQSALVRKDAGHYRRHFPAVPDDLPYVWPPAERPAHARRTHAPPARA
jgi:hypothetical protein